MKYNTSEIMERIKSGQDRDILDYMYKNVYPKVRRYVLGNSGTNEDCKDVFQEAMLVFYKLVIEDKCGQIKDVEAFLIGVSRNNWINKIKKISKEVDMIEKRTDSKDDPLITMIMHEKWDAFQKLFEMIGEKCRELLTYSTYEKLSMEEIAVKMNFSSANAAKTNNYRCKQKLIELVMSDNELANSLRS